MLTNNINISAAVQRITPIAKNWLANGEYPTGGDIWIDHTRYGNIYIAIINRGAVLPELRKLVDDIEDENNHGDALRHLSKIAATGHIAYGQGKTPSEALFYAEMQLRKQSLVFIHRLLMTCPENKDYIFDLYSPLKSLDVNERNQFLDDCSLLLKNLDKNWYEYSDSLQARISSLEELLKESATTFRFYEDSHRKRGPEHLAKADRNADIAARIETALGIKHEHPNT